jgi:hypothetical protein
MPDYRQFGTGAVVELRAVPIVTERSRGDKCLAKCVRAADVTWRPRGVSPTRLREADR